LIWINNKGILRLHRRLFICRTALAEPGCVLIAQADVGETPLGTPDVYTIGGMSRDPLAVRPGPTGYPATWRRAVLLYLFLKPAAAAPAVLISTAPGLVAGASGGSCRQGRIPLPPPREHARLQAIPERQGTAQGEYS